MIEATKIQLERLMARRDALNSELRETERQIRQCELDIVKMEKDSAGLDMLRTLWSDDAEHVSNLLRMILDRSKETKRLRNTVNHLAWNVAATLQGQKPVARRPSWGPQGCTSPSELRLAILRPAAGIMREDTALKTEGLSMAIQEMVSKEERKVRREHGWIKCDECGREHHEDEHAECPICKEEVAA